MNNDYLLESDIKEIYDLLGASYIDRLVGKTILISGAQGFIGQYLIDFFLYLNKIQPDEPIQIVAIDNLITNTREEKLERKTDVEYLNVDVIQGFDYSGSIDYVIHAAGIASPFYYAKFPIETMEVATVGTKNLLTLALEKQVEGFLFFSSSEVYGDPDCKHVPTNESYSGNVSCVGSRACYDESKRLGETICKVFQSHFGVPTKIVRPFNIYGPGMRQNDYRVMPEFLSKALSGKPLNIYKPGTQTRTFCYSTDALNGFLRVLLDGVPGEPYNIGNDHPEITISELAEQMELVLGSKIEKNFIEHPDFYPSDEPIRRCPDLKKASIHLAYQPTVSLSEGLRRSINWASEHYISKL